MLRCRIVNMFLAGNLSATVVCLTIGLLVLNHPIWADETDDQKIARLSLDMFSLQGAAKSAAVDELAAFKDRSLIPTFVLAMRWTGSDQRVAQALSELAGEPITHWHEAYNWQERNPDIVPHPSYRTIKLRFLGNTDKRFLALFEPPEGNQENMKIRLEEIVWGGVLFDGIPSLDYPDTVAMEEADYLLDDDLVFGVEINGDSRAYPLRIMGWHEMMNDVIGGVPVALAYCTLCGSGILFETQVKALEQPLIFGSSGLLFRSNKLMFDRETHSLWNQFTGEPVVGSLVDSAISLRKRPLSITRWGQWKKSHPDTKVLSLQTGFTRDYGSGVTYQAYFASPDLMFPASQDKRSGLAPKDYVFGIRDVSTSKAWPLDAFSSTSVINDRIGSKPIVLIGDEKTRTVRAYEREIGDVFAFDEQGRLMSANVAWVQQENALFAKSSKETRRRVAGHVSYWFAWDNFAGLRSDVYQTLR